MGVFSCFQMLVTTRWPVDEPPTIFDPCETLDIAFLYVRSNNKEYCMIRGAGGSINLATNKGVQNGGRGRMEVHRKILVARDFSCFVLG